MKKNVLLFTLLGLLYSCSFKDHKVSESDRIAQELKLTDLEDLHMCLYSDYFSDVKYIPLESTPESMIGRISTMEIISDDDILIFDDSKRQVLLFDSIGTFKNKIGSLGHSANEYVDPWRVVYDKYTDNIIVYDNVVMELKYYDKKGKLVKKTKLPWNICSLGIIDEKHIAVFMNYSNDGIMNEEVPGHNFKIINREGKIIKEFMPYTMEMTEYTTMQDRVFKNVRDTLYCFIPYTNDVYTMTNESFAPRYKLNFVGHNIQEEWYKLNRDEFYSKIFGEKEDVASCNSFFETDDLIFINFRFRNPLGKQTGIISKSGSKENKSYFNIYNDMNGVIGTLSLLWAKDNKLYYEANSNKGTVEAFLKEDTVGTDIAKKSLQQLKGSNLSDATGFFKDLFEASIKFYENRSLPITEKDIQTLEQLQKAENPVIQVCTLKKS